MFTLRWQFSFRSSGFISYYQCFRPFALLPNLLHLWLLHSIEHSMPTFQFHQLFASRLPPGVIFTTNSDVLKANEQAFDETNSARATGRVATKSK
jgi:hypothetical protein